MVGRFLSTDGLYSLEAVRMLAPLGAGGK